MQKRAGYKKKKCAAKTGSNKMAYRDGKQLSVAVLDCNKQYNGNTLKLCF